MRRAAAAARLVATFMTGQVALQALQFAAGLVIIRSWGLDDYAAWAILAATQATIAAVADLGAKDGVVSLSRGGSTNGQDLSRLIDAALALRTRHLLLLSVPTAIYIVWLSQTGIVPDEHLFAIILLTLVTAFANGWISYHALPFLLERRMGHFYAPQLAGAAARLGLVGLLFAAGWASLLSVLAVTAFTAIVTGLYFRIGRRRVAAPPPHDPASRALGSYIYAMAPATIYFAFQDQIAIFLLSVVGSPAAISQTSAIGRLALLFQLLYALNSMLILPWIARTGPELLARRAALFAAAGCTFAALVVALVWTFPQVPLLVLGNSYAGAAREMQLAAAAACLLYAANAFWCINVARGWLWRWTGTGYAIVVGTTQLGAILILGVRDAADAFRVSIVVAAAIFIYHLLHTLAGLRGKPANESVARELG